MDAVIQHVCPCRVLMVEAQNSLISLDWKMNALQILHSGLLSEASAPLQNRSWRSHTQQGHTAHALLRRSGIKCFRQPAAAKVFVPTAMLLEYLGERRIQREMRHFFLTSVQLLQ